jgi:hypothetical protein
MRSRHIYMKHRRAGLFHSEWFLTLGASYLINAVAITLGTCVDLAKGDFSPAAVQFGVAVSVGLMAIWVIRCELRCIDVKWVAACADANLTREQLTACLWTRGEQGALAAWDDAWRDQIEGTPWAWAQRPLTVYKMGRGFNNRVFMWRARRSERTARRDAERAQRS